MAVASLANQASAEAGPDRPPEELTQHAFELLQAGRLVESEQVFRQALAGDPNFVQARFGLGTVYYEAGRVGEAITMLEEVHEEFPDFYPVLNNLAWIYATTEELHYRNGTRAIRLAQEAIFQQPQRFQVWNTLAEAYYVLGDYSRAERASRQALRYARAQGAPQEQQTRYEQSIRRARTAAQAEAILAAAPDRIERISSALSNP